MQIFFAGSTPKTLMFFFLNPSSKIPILLPISITKSFLVRLNLEIIESAKEYDWDIIIGKIDFLIKNEMNEKGIKYE